jgi:hypothetical protein
MPALHSNAAPPITPYTTGGLVAVWLQVGGVMNSASQPLGVDAKPYAFKKQRLTNV